MNAASQRPASPWKPCDLRGVYPSSVSEDLFRRVGTAIGSEMEIGDRVVVAGDVRLSTPALKTALIDGLTAVGLCVLDYGQIPTPLAYFAARQTGANGVFIVTASHNPQAHNGLKWMLGILPPEPADIDRIRRAAEMGVFRRAVGRRESDDIVPAYRDWLLTRWGGTARALGPIVIDAGNGAWSDLAPGILRELGFDVTCLFCEPDGHFPNRSPDCARAVNLAALRSAVVERKAALGIAWDGDGDRVAFVDENGAPATTDEISILLARHLLKEAPRSESVVCDIKLSDGVRREILTAGGRPLLERSGHAFMRRRLLTDHALLGLDACGHYFFREAGSRDDGLYSALMMLRILEHAPLSDLRRSAGPLFSTPELRLPESMLDYSTVIARLRLAFPGAEESDIDGARLVLDEGIVLARESSTESVVSLRVEGFSSRGYKKLVRHCLTSLSEADVLLRRQISEAEDSAGTVAHFAWIDVD